MQSNSQGHHDGLDPKMVLADNAPDVRSENRDHYAELGQVDDIVVEKTTAAVFGVVTDCLRLNVRKEPSPDGAVLTTIDALSEVMVDINASSGEFYKVCTASGIEGFCMTKYIALRR